MKGKPITAAQLLPEVQLYLSMEIGDGLPCSTWQLPADVYQTLLILQSEVPHLLPKETTPGKLEGLHIEGM